ncbi:MAG TPA: serine hydrolase domain-containing protein, partial [Gemmatimonadota bacterium]|nr:serine hydrolase domain-containing protein [Gemmatimonadota bacterium]
HYRDDEFLSSKHYDSVEQGLAIFEDDTLLFRPGTEFHYSTYGWDLVSAVIEGASGEPFLRYMREHVLEPLDLSHTVADQPDSLIPYRARPYDMRTDGTLVNAPWVDNSYKWAGGGYLSTPSDLVRYATRLEDGELLLPKTLRLLFTSQETTDGKPTHYGMGWFVRADSAGRRTIYHSGGSVGGTTFLLLYPDQGVAAALVMNLTGSKAVADALGGTSLADIAIRLAGPYLEDTAALGGSEPR